MHDKPVAEPDSTAVRVALWRALHVEVDSPPHVFEDEVGLKLAAPDEGWRRVMSLNIDAQFFISREVAKRGRDAAVEHAGAGRVNPDVGVALSTDPRPQ